LKHANPTPFVALAAGVGFLWAGGESSESHADRLICRWCRHLICTSWGASRVTSTTKGIVMIGRRQFGIAGISAITLAAMQPSGYAEDRKDEHKAMFEDCSEACTNCQRECDECAHHCAMMLAEGKKEHMNTLATCQDCADVCAATAHIVARHGAFANMICGACAEACAKCGKECEKYPGDKAMVECAKECRECEKACREMLKHGK
jgi:hypothetical protein